VNKVINSDWKKDFAHYQTCMQFLGANVPLETLCLPATITTILKREEFEMVYDLLNVDLTKIKGLGPRRINLLTSRLDEFLAINI